MSGNLHVIVGLGATGLSCAKFLTEQGIEIAMNDSRENPPGLDAFKKNYPAVPITCGKLDEALFSKATRIVLSPGVAPCEPAIVNSGKPVIGDIELFSEVVSAPVIAITGTNAKSTVTTLVGEMALAAGVKTQVGGNLGTPALDLLTTPRPELFVLELSSFQLDTTYSLAPKVATVLNITPDHMDRYATLELYGKSKQQVYRNCEVAVWNKEDRATYPEGNPKSIIAFTLGRPDKNEFGIIQKNGEMFLAHGDTVLLSTAELPVLGQHYQANALAALAIGYGCGLPMEPMLKVLREFQGLAHRCQIVRERAGVKWYNDSKGTNVGATLAAIHGLGAVIPGKLVLIAGGVGKNADFSPLVPAIEKYVKAIILIGKDAPIFAKVVDNKIPTHFATTMDEAVKQADKLSEKGDSVLLSPACASLDMFRNFEHRGDVFVGSVKNLS